MELLVAALRMRPDRLILGEMRGEEALAFVEAINTGHRVRSARFTPTARSSRSSDWR